jgi:hypothetical protein
MKHLLLSAFAVLLTATLLVGQQQQEPEKEKKATPPPITPAARLAAAKTAFVRMSGGSDTIPYDVISETLQGWGRFTLVESPEKADIVIEVSTTEDHPTSVSASSRPARHGGGMDRSTTSSKDITISQIKLMVYDARSKMALWSGSEHPKGALKRVDRENNEVEAAQRMVARFHDQLEPPTQ